MSRVVSWLQQHENQLFFWVNRRLQHAILDRAFAVITHLGGASVTILVCLSLLLLASGDWRIAALQSLVALIASHLPVHLVKKKYPRKRPYLVHPGVNLCKNPLKDHSFPSGHSTAIFSVIVPFVAVASLLGLLLVPLAFAVSVSRIYLGLHYPSDCIAGIVLGSATAFLSVAFVG
ncbi:phosphatase PAP2 family protein [Paenibacillus koleovorans]|uniref:phosphatase PAP2 family protein n=1 Tax=Paenibacillus koleovorans TaxID=121608 RepID=UPI000FDBF50F|nr:phosphatase PAP2 family protein [Paenibacillus koleovorans]